MNKDIFRKELRNVKPYIQGKPAEEVQRELGLKRVEKLASNENQLGSSPKAVEAIKKEISNINFYPESNPYKLVNALAEKLGVEPDNIAVGNAGEGLLRLINLTFINEGDEVIFSEPTFSIYESQAALMGGKAVSIPLKGDRFDIDGMLDAINESTKIVWLCTPNNPTGHIASQEDIHRLVQGVPDNVILVLDEAYYEYARKFDDYPKNNIDILKKKENVILLRTFSKVYGIAGLRVGYIISSKTIADMVNSVKLTFEVNRIAQVAATAALQDDDYLDMVVSENKKQLLFLADYCDKKGLAHFPSYANYIWMDTKEDSRLIFEALQRKGVIIRPGYLWGWDTWIRVSTGTDEQMKFFTDMLDEVLDELQ